MSSEWDLNLLPDQKAAVCRTGCHVCILAGPGTGKTHTIVHRILYLKQVQNIPLNEILVLTFTRSATHELKQRVVGELDSSVDLLPRVATLHSFALSQLLKNAPIIDQIPRPLRIADDWEERYIIEEDIKKTIDADKIKTVRTKFAQLSADWETLNADKDGWDTTYPDPQFLGAWRNHRNIYGYMLRSELVYQLKKSIEQHTDFMLEQSFKHLLVDEYQDLNRCDLEVIKILSSLGVDLYVTGDDDQSIYGFRYAFPQGIRMFSSDYSPCEVMKLENCIRCGANILELGLFIANLDVNREPKPLTSYNTDPGEVHLLNFTNQYEEATSIAIICKHLVYTNDISPSDILILTRTDRNGVFSTVLQQALTDSNVPASTQTDIDSLLDIEEGRIFYSFLRLCVNPRDHLAWRTLIQMRRNSIGPTTISKLFQYALENGLTFMDALNSIISNTVDIGINKINLRTEMESINEIIENIDVSSTEDFEDLMQPVIKIMNAAVQDDEVIQELIDFFKIIIDTSEIANLRDLISVISTSLGDKEQYIDISSINIMTMHRAKGLTAEAVFIVAAEDEYIPGNQLGEEKVSEERRLLYVSLTRAKRLLYITFCNNRIDRQIWSGRNSSQTKRNLSRFLIDAPLVPTSGRQFANTLT